MWNPFRPGNAIQAAPPSASAHGDTGLREAATIRELYERIAELEFAAEDASFMRMGGDIATEFSRPALNNIIRLSRIMYLKNPNIRRAVQVQALYCWAQGVSVEAEDEAVNAVVQQFMDDRGNRAELFKPSARFLAEVELQIAGNLFLTLFTGPEGEVAVRSIPVEEITDIVTDPNDRRRVLFYRREWTARQVNMRTGQVEQKRMTAFYPHWLFEWGTALGPKPTAIGDHPIEWDARVYHVAVGGMRDQKFGIPETYPAIDWARAYKEFLEDRATINRAHARFAWNVVSKAGSRGVDALRRLFGSSVATGSEGLETNPAPATGAAFISTDQNKLEPVRTAGATVSAEEGRRFLLQVASAMGLPETFFGDVSTGNLATASSLERPTELMFRERQELWRGVYEDLCQFAFTQRVLATKVEGWAVDARGSLIAPTDEDGKPVPSVPVITFPSILDHDPAVLATAWALFQPQMPPRIYLSVVLDLFNVPDADDILEAVFPNGDGMDIPEPDPEPSDPAGRARLDAMAEALRIIRESRAA